MWIPTASSSGRGPAGAETTAVWTGGGAPLEYTATAGWLVLPADMPLVRSETILRLAQALPWHTLVYPQYQGRRGHPVGFSGELASELVRLTGDEGARRVVARYPGHAIDVEDAGVLQDFDTEDDFRQWDGQHADLC